jgi:Zn-dependent metalloprotease
MVFEDGDKTIFNRFRVSVEVIGHEVTHGVTGSEVSLTISANRACSTNPSPMDSGRFKR